MNTIVTPHLCRRTRSLAILAVGLAVIVPVGQSIPAVQAQRYTGSASRPQQTLLTVNLSGTAAVYVNGQLVGTFSNSLSKRDISRYVRRGENHVRVDLKPGSNTRAYNVDGVPNGFLKVAYAFRTNEFKNLSNISFGSELPGRPHKYSYSTNFTLDSLTPGSTGTRERYDPAAPSRYGYNSRSHQTVMTVNSSGDVSVFVNGNKVETFSDTVIKRDISRFVRRGSNSLTIQLHPGTNSAVGNQNGLPSGFVRVGYALPQNQFRPISTTYFGPAAHGQRLRTEYRATFVVGQ